MGSCTVPLLNFREELLAWGKARGLDKCIRADGTVDAMMMIDRLILWENPKPRLVCKDGKVIE